MHPLCAEVRGLVRPDPNDPANGSVCYCERHLPEPSWSSGDEDGSDAEGGAHPKAVHRDHD